MARNPSNDRFTILPLRLRIARLVARILPPLLAPTAVTRLYPFDCACRDGKSVSMRAATGSVCVLPMNDAHGYYMGLHSYHDWRLLVVAQTVLSPGDTVVELGGNIGTETIGFSDTVGPNGAVITFEPVPANLAALQSVLSSCKAENVKIVGAAVGSATGDLPFEPPTDERYTGIGHLASGAGSDRSIRVAVTTLDSALPPSCRPSFIAMDIEGAERAALVGAAEVIRRTRPVIVVEACARHAHRAGSSLHELKATLEDFGYEVRAIRRYGLSAPDLRVASEPCNWLGVPLERAALLRRISMRLLLCGVLPPWTGVNPMFRRRRFNSRTTCAPGPSQ